MKNKLFEKIMRQAEQYKDFNDSLIRLFESILGETDDNGETFTVNSDVINKTLTDVFNNVINQCANENTLQYSTVSVNKKSIPYNYSIK